MYSMYFVYILITIMDIKMCVLEVNRVSFMVAFICLHSLPVRSQDVCSWRARSHFILSKQDLLILAYSLNRRMNVEQKKVIKQINFINMIFILEV